MRKKWMLAVIAVSLLGPTTRLWADDEKKEYASDEKKASREHQQAEEREAMEHYQKAVAKHGQDSLQAKKAWKHVLAEYKEHGDTPPAQPMPETTPSASK